MFGPIASGSNIWRDRFYQFVLYHTRLHSAELTVFLYVISLSHDMQDESYIGPRTQTSRAVSNTTNIIKLGNFLVPTRRGHIGLV